MKDYSEDQADLLSQELGIEDESEGSSQSTFLKLILIRMFYPAG